MTKSRLHMNLREPCFLLWLGQFVGIWKLGAEVQVRRRNDGFLEVVSFGGKRKVSLASVLRRGEFVRRPKSPLGLYPVILSASLMRHWLPAKDLSRFRGAWNVGAGQRAILEAIEKRISELPGKERNHRWLAWWAAWAGKVSPPSEADVATHRGLYRLYRRAANTRFHLTSQGKGKGGYDGSKS